MGITVLYAHSYSGGIMKNNVCDEYEILTNKYIGSDVRGIEIDFDNVICVQVLFYSCFLQRDNDR